MPPKVFVNGRNNMTSKQILIVEDERPIREMIAFGLKRAGFEVREAEDCRAARAALADRRPDLVLIDWMLPDMSGLELTRSLKRDRETRELPVIMLTARAEEGDKVAGLEGGADDYVTKPFSPRELLARINAVLRRSGSQDETERVRVRELSLDRASHRVMVGERTVALGPTEYRMLEFFMTHPERVYTRDQLLDRIWGGNVYVEERTIDVHIRRLRKALEDFGYDHFVQTVRGSGTASRHGPRPDSPRPARAAQMNSPAWLFLARVWRWPWRWARGAGWLFGHAWVGLALALAIYLVWQLANLLRVLRWLRRDAARAGARAGRPVGRADRADRAPATGASSSTSSACCSCCASCGARPPPCPMAS